MSNGHPIDEAPVRAAAAPSPETVQQTRRRTLTRMRWIAAAALVLPLLIFAALAGWLYRQEFERAQLQLDGNARIAQEHALKLFETNEMLMQRMLDLLGSADDASLLARGDELHQRLQRMAAGLPQVQGLFVHGADSRMLASSRVHPPPRQVDYSDREWHRAHREGREPVFVTEQLTSRATGEPFFDMSRRRVLDDRPFAGTVNVSLRPEYLTRFYEELAANDPGLRVTVLRSDGRLLARWPDGVPSGARVPMDGTLMRQIADGARSGRHAGDSSFDAVPRLRAFRKLEPYALYVVAARDRAGVIAAWQRRVALLAAIALPALLALGAMAWLALRRTREELDALQRLDEETARRQRIEVALLQSQKFEAMGRLTGGVAHDFNNLLMVVTNSLYLHQRLRPDVAGSPQLQAIGRAVDAGTKLTRQLLAFSRRQALLPERLQLQERLPMLLDLLRPVLGHSIELSGTVAPGTGPIEVDPAELELALINLAVNAKDAMPQGGRLAVAARNAAADELAGGPFVVVEVADTGDGIDPAVVDRVFEPFFTTKPVGQGTGLGLSQVSALCQSAGGMARIDSRPGSGTRVRLYMRRSAVPQPSVPADGAVPTLETLQGRVLLVEDNDGVAGATRELLETLGCKVVRVGSGVAALEHLRAQAANVDVVLSDIEMPGGVDGIALAARLRDSEPGLPVLLMTGYAARLEQAVGERFEVLPKPCSPEMLAESIAKALARRRAAPSTSAEAVAG